MKLVDRISQQNSTTPVPFQRSLMSNGPAKRTVKDSQAEGFQQLKLAVHNRLFEMLDVTRLESLEPVLAAQKVTEAISAILDDEGRLLTDTDKAHLIEEIKNELLGLGRSSRFCGTMKSPTSSSTDTTRFTSKSAASSTRPKLSSRTISI